MCSVDGCDREPRGPRTPLCNAHYFRLRRTGSTGSAKIWDRRPAACAAADCDRPVEGEGYCQLHRRRVRKGGSPDYRADQSGDGNPAWIGDAANYATVHGRLRAARGRAAEHTCSCGAPAKHWAYLHDDPDERFQPGVGAYSLDLTRYAPMCVPCHKKFDLSLKG